MAIIQTVGLYDFEQAFKDANRMDQFSYHGKKVLFDYLEEYSESTGEDVELDVIALCCEYYESSIEEIAESYNLALDEDDAEGMDDSEKDEALEEIVREYLEENSIIVGEVPGGFVYGVF